MIAVLAVFGLAIFLLIWGWIVAIKSTAAPGATGLFYVTWAWDILGAVYTLIALIFYFIQIGKTRPYWSKKAEGYVRVPEDVPKAEP